MGHNGLRYGLVKADHYRPIEEINLIQPLLTIPLVCVSFLSVGGAKLNKMDYFEKKKVEDKIKSDINDIKEFDEVEHFIDANFQQFLRNGEYDDNSMDLSYHYKMLKEIEADERFMSKLNFVLGKYVRGAVAK
jgi:hypothetical protein